MSKELITKIIEHKMNILANDIYKNYENVSKQNYKKHLRNDIKFFEILAFRFL